LTTAYYLFICLQQHNKQSQIKYTKTSTQKITTRLNQRKQSFCFQLIKLNYLFIGDISELDCHMLRACSMGQNKKKNFMKASVKGRINRDTTTLKIRV
jgi:hypothetical protein